MTEAEMINEFLKNNEVTTCPSESKGKDGEVQSRRRRQFINSNMPSYSERLKEKYKKECIGCGKEFTGYPESYSHGPNHRTVNSKYVGDIYCKKCIRDLNDFGYIKKRVPAKIAKKAEEYGSMKNYETFKELDKSITKSSILSSDKEGIKNIISSLEWMIDINMQKKHMHLFGIARKRLLDIEDEEWENDIN